MSIDITRRGFVGAAAATVAAGASSVAVADEAGWKPEKWDYEADIVIVGCGGAGASAGIVAADEGLGDVIILEAAPEGHEGGNTACSQGVVFSGSDADGLIAYQKNLNGAYKVPDETLRAWAEGLIENIPWLESIDLTPEPTKAYSPEYPDIEGSGCVQCYLNESTIGCRRLWDPIKEALDDRGTQVLFDSRVVSLVQNPATSEVVGVVTENGVAVKARKGVLLCCGGFLFDEELSATFYPVGFMGCLTSGSPWNRGDGLRMAMQAGCNLWHMSNYATGSWAFKVPYGDDGMYMGKLCKTSADKDYIYVNGNANRFMYEESVADNKHGKEIKNDMYVQMTGVYPAYLIMGHISAESSSVTYNGEAYSFAGVHGLGKTIPEYVEDGVVMKADTIEELAEKLGLDPTALAHTVNTYNENAANNVDPDFGRGTTIEARGFKMYLGDGVANDTSTPLVEPFDLVQLEPPFYGVQIIRAGVNSQGGPERDEHCNVKRPDGTAIPRLYTAGELGAIYPYMYNGGGNVAEALATGRIAAREIGKLEPWE